MEENNKNINKIIYKIYDNKKKKQLAMRSFYANVLKYLN